MRHPYIVFIITVVFFIACNYSPEPATATPRPTDEPKKFGRIQLSYEDTTSAEYKAIVRRLDSFYRIQVAKGFNGSVLVGYKGKILYERYYGYANRNTKQKLTPYRVPN